MRMGAMSMKLIGTVEVVEKDEAAHRAVLRVRSARVQAAPATPTRT